MIQFRLAPAVTPAMCAAAVAVGLMFVASSSALAGDLTLQPRSGDPLPGLTADQLDRFFKGQERFIHDFTAQEGLGPAFNKSSCAVCHSMPAVGGSGSIAVNRFGAINATTNEYNPLAEFGGSLFQMAAIIEECEDAIPTQEQVETLLGPGWWAISNDPNGGFFPVQRITNSALGAGLVEAIADEDILAHAVMFGGNPWSGSPPPGISRDVGGHAHMVFSFEDEKDDEDPKPRVGRMGWKAQVATVLTFSADASRNELGITNRFLTQAPPPQGDLDLLAWCENLKGINDMAPHPNDQPQLDPHGENIEFIDRITDFQRFLAPPPQTPRNGMTGEQIFNDIGCAQCHVSSFTTRDDDDLEDAIRNRTITPYSDFLLHDMGLAGDIIEQGDGILYHMRTPSLWGLRDRDPILHDGRVGGGSLADRIYLMQENNVMFWHSDSLSAARPAALEFLDLPQCDKDRVIDFLDSLGRIEFDFNGDLFIGDLNFLSMIECYTGTRGDYIANPCPCPPKDPDCCCSDNPMDYPCAVFDIGQTGTVDHTDFELFLTVYEGEQSECELWLALADGVAPGIDVPVPAECLDEPCVGDLTDSGSVGVADLLELLACWGPVSPGCESADLTDNGSVGVSDLLELLANWGPSPNSHPCGRGSRARPASATISLYSPTEDLFSRMQKELQHEHA